jgi:hypothetical protein
MVPTISQPRTISPFALFLMIFLLLAGCCGSQKGSDSGAGADAKTAGTSKLDPELRSTSSQLVTAGQGDSLLTVLVHLTPGCDCRTALESAGLVVDAVVGDVMTGRAPARALTDVAAVPSVVKIQPARTYRAGETEKP